jgi:ribosome-associated protein
MWRSARRSSPADARWHHQGVDELVTPDGWRVDPAAVTWTATRSGGPGGQHANTSDTAVTATLDVSAAGLPDPVRARVTARLGAVITARSADTRSQWRNRQLAWERLAGRLDAAARPPRAPRRTTRPSRAAVAERLEGKRRRSEIKRHRRPPTDD